MTWKNFSILFTSLLILVVIMITIFGSDKILRLIWNIPTMHPVFADIRTIVGVNETLSYGLDPLVSNPGDPWGRAMNYPRIWQYLAEIFNFNQNTAMSFGFINLSLYIFGFLLFSSKLNLSKAMLFVLLITFLSPASVLAMERGNIDIVMFFLISLSLLYVYSSNIFCGIILLASFLKIFPIFAIAGLLKHSKKSFITASLISFLIFIIYVIFNIQDIILIKNGTPQSTFLSYGMNIVWMQMQKVYGINTGISIKILTYLYVIVLFSFIYKYLKKNQAVFSKIDKTYIDTFRVGSAIYIATFLLGNNWDYRLIFLIFTIPQFILWTKSNVKNLKFIAILSIISIIYTMWYLDFVVIFSHKGPLPIVWVVDELSNWALFSVLTFLFIITLPNWLLEFTKIKHDSGKQTI